MSNTRLYKFCQKTNLLKLKAGNSFFCEYGALIIKGKVFRYFRSNRNNKLARMYFRGVHLLYPCHEKYKVAEDSVIVNLPFSDMFDFSNTHPTEPFGVDKKALQVKVKDDHMIAESRSNIAKDIHDDV